MRRGKNNDNVEYGPLGPGHAPEKDPLKGVRGVQSGTLIMEAITVFLVLTVILRIDEGSYWTSFNQVYVCLVGAAHVALSFLQRYSWALIAAVILQVFVLAGGFLVHLSMGIVGVIFVLVWWYLLYLRRNLMERMKRGLLTTQHL
ncbi:DUF4233 domain-containing protein [Corynebacterium poyangense]|uniref:DUF4233 domain-containing protein n=1 Tax=Corynebacterium poyangense TaxID=2684405 RepID=A0A7H0SQG7_9CORY|nr:DUF4233 domain-containing protein [Corynebacterium poyangense]MBZ8178322.1 DUF4233 domain-containing protein [Corynebacterium poyangense]QNQ90792.1 DUF4233 domain-containing protein [Corynebacterium poyangense]